MVADITAVLVQAFHMIRQICFCYGFDPNDIPFENNLNKLFTWLSATIPSSFLTEVFRL